MSSDTTNPFVGTWKVNVAKSTFIGPAPKSATAKVESIDNGLKHTTDTVEADGKTSHHEWAAKYDGKDYPFTGMSVLDAVALIRIDANTFGLVFKKGGQEEARGQNVVSGTARP